MTANPLTEIADRVQALTSACRETDALIWAEINGRDIRWEEKMLLGRSRKPPHDECRIGYIDPGAVARNFTLAWSQPEIPAFTASLDAAMTLALNDRLLSIWQTASLRWYARTDCDMRKGEGATAALALVSLWLKAREDISTSLRALAVAFDDGSYDDARAASENSHG